MLTQLILGGSLQHWSLNSTVNAQRLSASCRRYEAGQWNILIRSKPRDESSAAVARRALVERTRREDFQEAYRSCLTESHLSAI